MDRIGWMGARRSVVRASRRPPVHRKDSTMDGTFAIPTTEAAPAASAGRGSKRCLVEGCACKDARIVSIRRARFFATLARADGETADRIIAAEDGWRLPAVTLD
jgi:hypothetical protein